MQVRTTRVACTARSLNSGDCFLLDGHFMVFLWIGKEANESEVDKGTTAMKEMVFTRRGIKVREQVVEEGSEPADFWFILGGQGSLLPCFLANVFRSVDEDNATISMIIFFQEERVREVKEYLVQERIEPVDICLSLGVVRFGFSSAHFSSSIDKHTTVMWHNQSC